MSGPWIARVATRVAAESEPWRVALEVGRAVSYGSLRVLLE